MKKISIALFFAYLLSGLLFTCFTGYYEIGTTTIESIRNFKEGSIINSFEKLFNAVETELQNQFWQQDKYIDIYGGIQKVSGRQIVVGSGDTTVIRSKNNNLYFGNTSSEIIVKIPDQSKEIKRVIDFNDYCKSLGTDLIYVVAPNKSAYINKSDFPLIAGMNDYQNFAGDMSKKLLEKGVKSLDLMSELKEKSSDYSSEFFSTDHHWKIETAFWGYSRICDYLNKNTTYKIDKKYYNIKQYDINIKKQSMQGSMGVRVGSLYHEKDDYALITPKYKTDFSVVFSDGFLNKREIRKNGSFLNAFLRKNSDKDISYGSYISSDRDRIFIDNKINNSGQKMLIIKDSFAIPVSAWMACASDKLWIVDLRYKQEESMYDLVKKKNIDTVIIMYNPEMFGSADTAFCFDGISKGN